MKQIGSVRATLPSLHVYFFLPLLLLFLPSKPQTLIDKPTTHPLSHNISKMNVVITPGPEAHSRIETIIDVSGFDFTACRSSNPGRINLTVCSRDRIASTIVGPWMNISVVATATTVPARGGPPSSFPAAIIASSASVTEAAGAVAGKVLASAAAAALQGDAPPPLNTKTVDSVMSTNNYNKKNLGDIGRRIVIKALTGKSSLIEVELSDTTYKRQAKDSRYGWNPRG